MLVTIHQHPSGPIPPYPDGGISYPPVWSDPIYENAVTFSATVESAPVGYTLTYRWVVVIEPQGYRRSLRALTERPPGPPVPFGGFAAFPEVWLPFATRFDLDPGKSRIEFERVYVECEVQASEGGLFGTTQTATGRLDLDLVPSPLLFESLFLTEKIERALGYSIPHWPTSVSAEADAFLTDPWALTLMSSTTLLFAALALHPEPWTKVAGTALGGILLAKFGLDTLIATSRSLNSLYQNCRGARSDEHLRRAGRAFALEGAAPVFGVLSALVFWRLARSASELAHEVKVARSGFLEQMRSELRTAGIVPNPPQAVTAMIDSSTHLVRRLHWRELLVIETGIGRPFIKGKHGEKAFSLDEPYRFHKPQNPEDHSWATRIELNGPLREFLKLSFDVQNIPQGFRVFPRYKFENGVWNILIPKGIWTEFSILYTFVNIVILPVDPELPFSPDDETFFFETSSDL